MAALNILLALMALGFGADAFAPSSYSTRQQHHHGRRRQAGSRVEAKSLLVMTLFGGLFGNEEQKNENTDSSTKGAASASVIDLPVERIKIGPLKFFLQIYLVAEQNKPVQGAWVLNSNEENGSLDMYYKDGTGMFSVALTDEAVKIDRYGQRPSLEYMLQESVMLHGVLDELNEIVFGENDVEEDKRLLRLSDKDSIVSARETLPARKE